MIIPLENYNHHCRRLFSRIGAKGRPMGQGVSISSAAVAISPMFASFVCCSIDRMQRGRKCAWSRSRCDGCGAILQARDLVPVVSYLLLSGRCRTCGAEIPRRLVVAEFSLVVVTTAAILISSASVPATLAFVWILFALAQFDASVGRLPNALTGSLALGGIVSASLGWIPLSVGDAAIGTVAGFFLPLLVALGYRAFAGQAGLGGGDIKLFGALGGWLGWQSLPALLLLSSCVALVAGLLKGGGLKQRIAFGPFIAIAGFAIWCWQTAR